MATQSDTSCRGAPFDSLARLAVTGEAARAETREIARLSRKGVLWVRRDDELQHEGVRGDLALRVTSQWSGRLETARMPPT